jgi:hypothetical protein
MIIDTINGIALERIRTSDPLVRSQVLYPTELPMHEDDYLRSNHPLIARMKILTAVISIASITI